MTYTLVACKINTVKTWGSVEMPNCKYKNQDIFKHRKTEVWCVVCKSDFKVRPKQVKWKYHFGNSVNNNIIRVLVTL